MTTTTEIRDNHGRAVRLCWVVLIGATTVSLIGNVVHALLPYISRVVVQIGAAAVPPLVLIGAVPGIASQCARERPTGSTDAQSWRS